LQILPVIAALVLVSLPGRLAGAIPLAALLVLFAAERRLGGTRGLPPRSPRLPPRAVLPASEIAGSDPKGRTHAVRRDPIHLPTQHRRDVRRRGRARVRSHDLRTAGGDVPSLEHPARGFLQPGRPAVAVSRSHERALPAGSSGASLARGLPRDRARSGFAPVRDRSSAARVRAPASRLDVQSAAPDLAPRPDLGLRPRRGGGRRKAGTPCVAGERGGGS